MQVLFVYVNATHPPTSTHTCMHAHVHTRTRAHINSQDLINVSKSPLKTAGRMQSQSVVIIPHLDQWDIFLQSPTDTYRRAEHGDSTQCAICIYCRSCEGQQKKTGHGDMRFCHTNCTLKIVHILLLMAATPLLRARGAMRKTEEDRPGFDLDPSTEAEVATQHIFPEHPLCPLTILDTKKCKNKEATLPSSSVCRVLNIQPPFPAH